MSICISIVIIDTLQTKDLILTSQFPAQKASNAEKNSIWWRHHAMRPRGVNRRTMSLQNKYNI